MIHLTQSRQAWGTPDFKAVLKREIEGLDAGLLPLQAGLSYSSHVLDEKFEAVVLGVAEEGGAIRARVGIFYAGIVAGCSCADDPTPIEAQNEYCEIQLDIDLASAETQIALLSD